MALATWGGEPVRASDAPSEFRDQCRTDGDGNLIFAAEVVGVRDDGAYVLRFDVGGGGVEHKETLQPRLRMPWHPRFLKGQLAIMLRRCYGRGRVIDGLEVRWAGCLERCSS